MIFLWLLSFWLRKRCDKFWFFILVDCFGLVVFKERLKKGNSVSHFAKPPHTIPMCVRGSNFSLRPCERAKIELTGHNPRWFF